MIKVIQGELYRIQKNRLSFLLIFLSTFFMLAFATTFRYNTLKTTSVINIDISITLNKYTEFLFSDYSLIIPITILLILYFTEDYMKGLHEVVFSKGISRMKFFFGKLFTSWIVIVFYIVFNVLVAYLFLISISVNQFQIEYSIWTIVGYLIIQMFCFIGYSCFLWLFSFAIRHRTLALVIIFVLLGTLYLYLTKISIALDMTYSLYKYWIVGLSHIMPIASYPQELSTILVTILIYIVFPIVLAFFIYQRADLRRLERK